MEQMNQDYIAEALRSQGLSSGEISTRLMKARMSTSGAYDPLTDSYKDQSDYEPSAPSNVPQMAVDEAQPMTTETTGEAAEPKSARQIYSEQIEKLKLPENPQDSDQYDWNIAREFYNWCKQLNHDKDYIPNDDELGMLEEIECFYILFSYPLEDLHEYEERDWIRKILVQRMEIRDSVLPPDNYSEIDNRIPLDIVEDNEAERINHEINPESTKSWNLPLLPISNYYDYIKVPSDAMSTKSEGLKQSTEPIAEGVAENGLLDNNHLPIDGYGKLAKKVINEFSQAYRVSRDVIAAMILLIVGGAANRKITLRSWNYTNQPSLWLAIVERSGSNKSEPLKRLMKPVETANKELVFAYKRAHEEFVANGSKGTPPVRQKIIISDSTPEIRNQLMVANGLILVRDELNGFFKDIGRYTNSGEVENLLSTWSGQGYEVDRVTAASFSVENPFLSIIGGVQPKVMADAFGTKGFAESGFLARWLFVTRPDSKVPDSCSETIISRDIENEWCSLITNLWKMEKREFRLSVEAGKAYQGYMSKTASIMNVPDCDDAIRAMYAKMRIYCLRFALIIHLLKYGRKAADEVERKTMDLAVQTCDVFAYWNRQAMSLISGSEAKKTISNCELLRELVERYNVQNQSELARLIGRSQQYVSKILNDKQNDK